VALELAIGSELALAGAILTTTWFTSFLSGVFGMLGGMLLIGLLSLWLPIPVAMVLHGLIQLAANGYRAFRLRGYLEWSVVPYYLLGIVPPTILFGIIAWVPSKTVVFLCLGIFPFVSWLKVPGLDIRRRWVTVVCGCFVTTVQIAAGASGPLLDVFFLQTPWDRRKIVATKALTQCFAHMSKLFYYGGLLSVGVSELGLPLWAWPLAWIAVATGTAGGNRVLERLSDRQFRLGSKILLSGVGAFFLYKAAAESLF